MQGIKKEEECFERVDHLVVNGLNKNLICQACGNVFHDPVINVRCGHTFCRRCLSVISGIVKCPLDGDTCRLEAVVNNRNIQDQINDLQFYCKYSRSFTNRYSNTPHEDGCSAVLDYGSKSDHENSCKYSWVDCPNNPKLCGKLWKTKLIEHRNTCLFYPCPNYKKGCIFQNTKSIVDLHVSSCLFQDQENDHRQMNIVDQLEALKTSQKEIMIKLNELTCRIEVLEDAVSNSRAVASKTKIVSKLPSEPVYDELDARSSIGVESTELLSVSSNNSKLPHDWTMPFQFKCVGTIKSHQSAVTSITMWKKMVFSSDDQSNIKMWSLDDPCLGCQLTLKAGKKMINMITVNNDHLYSVGEDLSLRCWNLTNMSEVATVESAHDHNITALVCSNNLLFTSSFTVIKVWNCETLSPVHALTGLDHWVKALAINSKKDKLYSGSHSTVNLWSATYPFELLGTIKNQFGSVDSLVVSNKLIIIGTYNKNIHAYDVNTLAFVHHFTGHVGRISCMVLSPLHNFFITGSSDSTLLLWCLNKMLPIQTLQRHQGGVNCVVVCDDMLLSGSSDTEIKVFKVLKL
ncbi:hypothetical protein HELRODRAFT_190506 [Helobdella robusta]|uniref:RING-type domain-containing protein n=1 Tax=Helobdella robusta TaxID=6412 RepID=T1FS20_HELRO|nr:hypothetical protein HELRODRAFT_190506 [Helobdella robusta]ESO09466.1 hypothetical protein HELRODRAFT_190506 [Helobdella robusta]